MTKKVTNDFKVFASSLFAGGEKGLIMDCCIWLGEIVAQSKDGK